MSKKLLAIEQDQVGNGIKNERPRRVLRNLAAEVKQKVENENVEIVKNKQNPKCKQGFKQPKMPVIKGPAKKVSLCKDFGSADLKCDASKNKLVIADDELIGIAEAAPLKRTDHVEAKTKKDMQPKIAETKAAKPITDIDENDAKNPLFASCYANDIFDYLYELELKHAVRKSHLKSQREITAASRTRLLVWLNEVHNGFHLEPETYYLTVSIIDLYLQEVSQTKCSEFQLIGMTALFLAAKFEELYPPLLDDLVYLCPDTTKAQVIAMEIRILKALDGQLSRPAGITFLRRFAKAAEPDLITYTMAKYFLELSTLEYSVAATRPSILAAAALMLALHISCCDPDEPSGYDALLWTDTLQHYSGYKAKTLARFVRCIAKLVLKEPRPQLSMIYEKYCAEKYLAVSKLPELNGALIVSIAQ